MPNRSARPPRAGVPGASRRGRRTSTSLCSQNRSSSYLSVPSSSAPEPVVPGLGLRRSVPERGCPRRGSSRRRVDGRVPRHVLESHRVVGQDVDDHLGVGEELQVSGHAAVAQEHQAPRRGEQQGHRAARHRQVLVKSRPADAPLPLRYLHPPSSGSRGGGGAAASGERRRGRIRRRRAVGVSGLARGLWLASPEPRPASPERRLAPRRGGRRGGRRGAMGRGRWRGPLRGAVLAILLPVRARAPVAVGALRKEAEGGPALPAGGDESRLP